MREPGGLVPDPAAGAGAVEVALAEAHRSDWARVLAATVRVTRDLDLAEECVQEAYAAALRSWASSGVPANPAAWLTTAARRRAIDAIRRESALRTRLPLLVVEAELAAGAAQPAPGDGDDGHGQPWPGQEGSSEGMKRQRPPSPTTGCG